MTFPPCPFSRDDCEFTEQGRRITLMYFPARYNRAGENLNPDRNTTKWTLRCAKCGSGWDCYQVGSDAPEFKRWNDPEETRE